MDILLSFQNASKMLNSEYYYFYAGKSMGNFLGASFTAADQYLELGIITPEDPWDRYAA